MRAPSEKTLLATFKDLDSKRAKLIRKIAKTVDEHVKGPMRGYSLEGLIEECCPKTQAYVRSMYSAPYNSHMWRVTVALHAINDIIDGYGVEGLGPTRGPDYAPPYEYVNMGDTYEMTLIYKRSTDTLSVGSWGDIVEKHPNWE